MPRPINPHSTLSLVEKHSEFTETKASKKRIAYSIDNSGLNISNENIATYIKCYKAASGNSEKIKALFQNSITDEQIKEEIDRHYQNISESIQGISYLETYSSNKGFSSSVLRRILVEVTTSKVKDEISQLHKVRSNLMKTVIKMPGRLALSMRVPIAFKLRKRL